MKAGIAAAPRFDPELIARHDVSGPRYTSYPAAPQFHAGFGEAELRAIARASNKDAIPRPLSLYVHVPFTIALLVFSALHVAAVFYYGSVRW